MCHDQIIKNNKTKQNLTRNFIFCCFHEIERNDLKFYKLTLYVLTQKLLKFIQIKRNIFKLIGIKHFCEFILTELRLLRTKSGYNLLIAILDVRTTSLVQ